MMTKEKYQTLSVTVLKNLAKARGLKGISTLKKEALITLMLKEDEKEAAAKTDTAMKADSAVKETMPQAVTSDSAAKSSDKPMRRQKTAASENGTGNEGRPHRGRPLGLKNGRKLAAAKSNTAQTAVMKPTAKPTAKTADTKSETSKTDKAERQAMRAEGYRPDMSKAEMSKAETAKVETAKAARDKTESIKAEAAQIVLTQTTASDAEPIKTDKADKVVASNESVSSAMPTAEADKAEFVSAASSESTAASDGTAFESYQRPEIDRTARGILEVMQDGYGFLRSENFLPGEDDIYVSPSQIRRFGMKTGDMVQGQTRARAQGEKFGALLYVNRINDLPLEESRRRAVFENMTPTFPSERIRLERADGSVATRIVDLISPIGKGQRGMIVSPPKAGKTTLLKDIAKSILRRDPNANLMILLIDERPEEVTDMKESVRGRNVEIIYSTFDELPDHHKRVSEMVIERAKRLVEHHKDVIILLDSITRLARAYNVLVPPSGRTLSGGLDPTALYMPKRFFGAARNMREGGSLTILATALVDTGSKMDDVVYEEFKGTGNMELILDRKLQERRIFPAIDIVRSGTRREDLLLTNSELEAVNRMRRSMNGMKSDEAVESILRTFAMTNSNDQVVNAVLSGRLT